MPLTILDQLNKRKTDDSLRVLKNFDHLVDFSSNDYMGLSRDQELIEKIQKSSDQTFSEIGGTGSRLISGNHIFYDSAERYLSKVFKSEKVLLFNSGYAASQGVVSSIPQRGDTILYDQLSHVCLKEGAWLSKAESLSFKHNDLHDLEQKLSRARGTCYVVTETIFSMDGDIAPMQEICVLCEAYNAWLIVDEAHSTGAYGDHGGGMLLADGLEHRVLARIYTFGKAIGLHGAAVAGSEQLIDYLLNFSRTFIYTTSLPPHSVYSIQQAFEYLADNQSLQWKLQEKIKLFRDEFPLSISQTAIQSVRISGNTVAKKIAAELQNQGFDVRAILAPTVKSGEERLRISLHVHNTDEEIKELAALLYSKLNDK